MRSINELRAGVSDLWHTTVTIGRIRFGTGETETAAMEADSPASSAIFTACIRLGEN